MLRVRLTTMSTILKSDGIITYMGTQERKSKLRAKGREIGHLQRELAKVNQTNKELDANNRALTQMNGAVVMHDLRNGQLVYFPHTLIQEINTQISSKDQPWSVTTVKLAPVDNMFIDRSVGLRTGKGFTIGRQGYNVEFTLEHGIAP
jgi:hypothetical protein